MSCIHLHLGQAGNQIGKSFWGLAEEEFLELKSVEGGGTFPSRRSSRMPTVPLLHPGGIAMFHEDSWARCLAVDSEPKVRNSVHAPIIVMQLVYRASSRILFHPEYEIGIR